MSLLHERIEREVLEKIKPTPEEYKLRDEIFSMVKSLIERGLKDRGLEGEVTLQGSARKETWLRGSLELDVFVLFEPRDKKWIKEVAFPALLEVVKELGPHEVRYAEHPYVRLYVKGVPVEVIPAFKVKNGSEAITAVDRTPFHTQWVLKKIKEIGEDIRDEIRLMKAFLKGIGAYGAEIKVQGFSGYATELLVLLHRGFRETIEAMGKWRPPVVVNAGKEALKRFPQASIILIDPVDPRRNVTAAVSSDTLALTILAANRYAQKPSIDFYFRESPKSAEALLPTYVIEMRVRNEPPETIWGELRRIGRVIVSNLRKAGFEVTRWGVWSDEKERGIIAIELLSETLPDYEVIRGPPVWMGKNVNNFLEKHKGMPIWVSDFRIYTIKKRRFKEPKGMIEEVLKSVKAESLILKGARIEKVSNAEGWLAEFVKGRAKWM